MIVLFVLVVAGAVLAWLVGSFFLRATGLLVAILGLVNLLTEDGLAAPMCFAAFAIGVLMWLSGHWMYAAKHHEYTSPLARRVFVGLLPSRMDPTRKWGVRVTPDGTKGR